MNALAEAAVYLSTIGLFSFVIIASARLNHETLLLACIPPVFVAMVMGFVMGIYAWANFGTAPVCIAAGVPVPIAWRLAGRYGSKDLLIAIYLAWSVALVLALVAFQFPDVK